MYVLIELISLLKLVNILFILFIRMYWFTLKCIPFLFILYYISLFIRK